MMSEKEQVMQYMLKLIESGKRDFARKTTENFGISKSTVYNYVHELCKSNIIKKSDAETSYELVNENSSFEYKNDGSLNEDRIFDADIAPLLADFKKNVNQVWRYAFTEMMNNAIEHSGAKKILVTVKRNAVSTRIIVTDNGVGIFRNIQDFMKREKGEELPLDECASLLFAGKFTTARELHSGEGIFFTSHLMDRFFIISDKILFSRDSFKDFMVKDFDVISGTAVLMALHNRSRKTPKEVFDRFSNIEEGFIRTHIPIAHIFPSGYPVSRSEARRLAGLISDFKEITLDFTGVEEVGQAFVHELFVVWQKRNPDSVLKVENACEAVDFMIKRVINTKPKT